MLFIYWSIIILAPVVSKEENIFEKNEVIFPIVKPSS
tara:strand:+ start:1023 stop:1133 length:111 start_codon:yes stop_codon:yes gene_type:complete